MAAFFGPESPRPFSVVSERFQREISIVKEAAGLGDGAGSPYSFGEEYEKALCLVVSRLAEINVDDSVCYVGPKKGSLASVLEDRLKLVRGIDEVSPGEILYEETSAGRLIPVSVVNCTAEEHFQKMARGVDESQKYDKVVVRDSLECLMDRKSFFMNAMRSLRPGGRVLVIQRPADMVTLPYFSEAKRRIHDSDVPTMDVINEIQSLGFDVEWDIELLPVLLTRKQWLSLLYHRYPNQLEVTAPSEIYPGLRELSEGSLKYLWDLLEFNDRLLFVSVSQPLQEASLPECRRSGGSVLTTSPAPLLFHLPVPEEMGHLVKVTEERRRRDSERQEWFGTFVKAKWEHVDSASIPAQLISNK